MTLTNEAGLTPRLPEGGPALALDFPGLRIGVVEYDEGPTGCTVFHFADGADCAVDVRGGSPGLFGGYPYVDAICFGGGSLYGLEAGTGVAAEILAARGTARWGKIACVSGAIIYDYGQRDTLTYPDKTLGRAAFRAAAEGRFPQGRRGAGRLASVGKIRGSTRFLPEPGGQGGAMRRIGDLRLACFTVVNSIGVVLDAEGRVLRGLREAGSGRRHTFDEVLRLAPEELRAPAGPAGGNTTISLVVTNQRMAPDDLRQLGRQVHSAMAGVIRPFHTLNDGDILFTASTAQIPATDWSVMALGEICSDLMAEAVRTAVTAEG